MFVNFDFDITVEKIVAANRLYNYRSESAVYRHNRQRWAVALKNTGTTYYTINGRDVLSDSNHPVLLPKGSTYTWRCTEPGECLIIEFDAPQVDSDIYSFAMQDTSFFVREFYQIQSNLYTATGESRMEAIYRLYRILLQIVRSVTKEYVPREKKQLLQPALQYISDRYYDAGITNDQLAALCGISTVYFRKSFEAVYGVSPIRYLHDFRTRKAKDILSSDYGSISQVAESVGYSSLYHFSKMFKAYTGLSPSQYVKQSRNS